MICLIKREIRKVRTHEVINKLTLTSKQLTQPHGGYAKIILTIVPDSLEDRFRDISDSQRNHVLQFSSKQFTQIYSIHMFLASVMCVWLSENFVTRFHS